MRTALHYCIAALLLAGANPAHGQQGAAGASQSTDTWKLVEPLVQRAFAQEDAGQIEPAIGTYEQILEIDPGNVPAMNSIAGLKGKLGDFEGEVSWANRAIAADPRFQPPYINKGNGLMLLGRSEEATKAFEKAVELDPKDPVAYYSLGVAAGQRNDLKASIGFYRQAIEANPQFGSAYFNLAAAYANLGDFDEAVAALNKLLELDPEAEDAKAMLAAIESDPRRKKK